MMPRARGNEPKSAGTPLSSAVLITTFGAAVWALHLTFIYGFHTISCASEFAGTRLLGLELSMIVITGGTIVALLAIFIGIRRLSIGSHYTAASRHSFEKKVGYWLALLAAIGVFWAGAVALFVAPC
jgi:hypothetical protein